MLVVSLVTRGSPLQLTGGHLYHRRMAEAAAARQASIEFVSATTWRNPLRAARGTVLVDSITAWSVAPWLWWQPRRQPVAAILHQPPGGIGQGPVRTCWQRPLDRSLYRRCALLIAASEALRSELVATHALPAERIVVIEPGCDLPESDSPPDDLRSGRRIAVLSVANWAPNKGIVELLDAVAGLPPDAVTVHLVGRDDVDPGYSKAVRARCAGPDLRDRVVCHGAVTREEVARLYHGADAFVLLSREETYGTVYGEALRAGLAVIGWRSGNLPNLVEDRREGCVIPPGDVGAVRDALLRMATDDAWRGELSAAAHRRGERLPSWSDAADAFFSALNQMTRG